MNEIKKEKLLNLFFLHKKFLFCFNRKWKENFLKKHFKKYTVERLLKFCNSFQSSFKIFKLHENAVECYTNYLYEYLSLDLQINAFPLL